jgi:D-alanyl-D-alanine carboxypeptidase
MDSFVQSRLANGYNYNQYDNPLLVGKDLHTNNLSWAGAAGGIVSNSEDITKWVKAIFIDDDILDKAQKEKLTRLISVDTGEPLSKTTEDDPRGFGLGVIQAYDEHLGRYWFYEGKTLGFRALYFYSPCNNVIISTIFNSATFTENDHASDLIKNIYKLILQENPKLRC